jgi:hypothetical protein
VLRAARTVFLTRNRNCFIVLVAVRGPFFVLVCFPAARSVSVETLFFGPPFIPGGSFLLGFHAATAISSISCFSRPQEHWFSSGLGPPFPTPSPDHCFCSAFERSWTPCGWPHPDLNYEFPLLLAHVLSKMRFGYRFRAIFKGP